MIVTEKEALQKWCPLIQKHCKATECMLFLYEGEDFSNTIKTTSPDEFKNNDTDLHSVYRCGLITISTITCGELTIPSISKEKCNENSKSDK